jgi:threonine aldolase
MLLGDESLIAEARVWQKRFGGNLIHLWPLAVSARLGLRDRLPAMPSFVARAQGVAAVLAGKEGVRVRPARPEAPMMHVFVDVPADRLQAAVEEVTAATGIALFYRCRAAEVPGFSMFELAIGASAAAIDDEELSAAVDELLARARARAVPDEDA